MDYSSEIKNVNAALSLDQIRVIVDKFPAKAQGEGAVLYSGWVGEVHSEVIAKELAHKTGLPIINQTARAKFLSTELVERSIYDSVRRISKEKEISTYQASKMGEYFLYGDSKAPPESPFSVKNSLWGQASREFTASVNGQVIVVASAANVERVLAQVEVPTALQSTRISTLAGHQLPSLRNIQTEGGITASLPKIQAQFVDASTKGVFILPDLFGGAPTQVAISSELATTLLLDRAKFASTQALSDAGFVRASVSPVMQSATLAPTAEIAIRKIYAPEITGGLGIIGASAVLYDATNTTSRVSHLRRQGNSVGAQSDIMHFGGRNLGALSGAALGAEVFGTGGAATGPFDLVIGGLGAIGGAFGGEKLADAYDQHRIYNQADPQGKVWNYDPAKPQQSWTRQVPTDEIGYSLSHPVVGYSVMPEPLMRTIHADPALADRLTFQANNAAVALALAHPSRARDPYSQEASPEDTPSRLAASWNRDAQMQQWSRLVVDRVLEHGITSNHMEQASTSRAAQLDAAAQQTMEDNLAGSRHGIAEHYQAMYQQRDWAKYGAMPEAVASALHAPATILQASDGRTYTREENGQWDTPGMLWGTNQAEGNVRRELDATERIEQSTSTHGRVSGSEQDLHSFSDAGHPQHALYNKLKKVFPPGTSDERLHQATAACYMAGIKQPQHLSGITGNDNAIHFHSNVLGASLGRMDMSHPAPSVAQTMQHVQQHDQQQAQLMGHVQGLNAQVAPQGSSALILGGR